MYIDIIMQKKKPIHPDVPDEDEEPAIIESTVDSNVLVLLYCNI